MSQNQNQSRATGRKMSARARAVPGSQKWGYARTGTEQVGIRVEILDGELGGSSVTWYGYFSEKSEQRTLEQLRFAGWNGDPNDVLNLPGLGSTDFELALDEQVDEGGNAFWRPTFINRAGVAMSNEMDDGAKRSFAARLRAMALASGGRPAPAPAAQRAPARPAQAAAAPQRAQAARPLVAANYAAPDGSVDVDKLLAEPGADDLPF